MRCARAPFVFALVVTVFAPVAWAATPLKTDPQATPLTSIFYANLQTLGAANGTAFGQQYGTWSGVNADGTAWTGDANRSDLKSVTGKHPAVTGWNFQTYLGLSSSSTRATFVQRIIDDFNRNTIIAVHWPMNNPITGGNDNDVTGQSASPSILARCVTAGDPVNATLRANLDAFAAFVGLLTVNGTPIPILFRPFHEMNGAGHWWGSGALNNTTEYKALWNYVLAYLRDTKGLHQLVYVYAPNGKINTTADYLANWPGDISVDVCGIDTYLVDSDPSVWNANLELVWQVANPRGMPAAFAEIGYKNGLQGSANPAWWTTRVLADFNLAANPLWKKCAYMMSWTNSSPTSYFVPYPGSPQASDLVNCVGDPHVLLQPDLPSMYTVPPPAGTAQLANLSVRTTAGSGSQTLIAGFGLSGAGAKPLLIRAIGPTLAQFGVPGAMADTRLELHTAIGGQDALVAANSHWGGTTALATAFSQLGAFPLTSGSFDSALLSTLAAGTDTAVTTGSGGIALVEIYDAQPAVNFNPPRLINVSARAQVGTGSGVLIAGFVVKGTLREKLLVRAIGPTLGAFGVAGVLGDPKLEIHATVAGQDTVIASNDNWGDVPNDPAQMAAAFASVGAFNFTAGSKDAALIATLAPGSYSAVVSGVGNTAGVALIEVYELP